MATAQTPVIVTTRRRSFLMRTMVPSAPSKSPAMTRTRSPSRNLGRSSGKYSTPGTVAEVMMRNIFISFSGITAGCLPVAPAVVYTMARSRRVSARRMAAKCLAWKKISEQSGRVRSTILVPHLAAVVTMGMYVSSAARGYGFFRGRE